MSVQDDRLGVSSTIDARATALTEPPSPDLAARVRELETANAALCDVICDSAPLAWVAHGDADAAHRWERKALSIVKTAGARRG